MYSCSFLRAFDDGSRVKKVNPSEPNCLCLMFNRAPVLRLCVSMPL